MSAKPTILRYDGKQPSRNELLATLELLVGQKRILGDGLYVCGCVIVDMDKAPDFITELHYFRAGAADLDA